MTELTEPAAADSLIDAERTAVERCQRGDVQAFGVLVKHHMKQAYFSALGLVGNHADAMDLSQEAFVRAYRAMERFDPRRRFFTWYYRILRNLCLNHLRDTAKLRAVHAGGADSDEELARVICHQSADPAVLAERNELTECLWKAMARLKPEDREILVLREMEDCSYAELAERLEIPAGTVMSRLFHARRHLKERLQESL
jgi:RNA polymerase sigma-70 factor (ECF subfamily)